MSALHSDHAAALRALPPISDDECLTRLKAVVSDHDRDHSPDEDHLDELAGLISRLAVPIEL